jgi:co-chaperonin GroES (HSP10)
VVFTAPTGSGNISSYYSPIEDSFEFKVGDMVRFATYNTIKADLYKIIEVTEPVTSYFGTNVVLLEPLKIKLDRLINYNDVNSRTFAFLRRKDDETSIILDFKKKEGATSNGLVIPYNLDKNIRNNVSNIISPLKDKILSKILIV